MHRDQLLILVSIEQMERIIKKLNYLNKGVILNKLLTKQVQETHNIY